MGAFVIRRIPGGHASFAYFIGYCPIDTFSLDWIHSARYIEFVDFVICASLAALVHLALADQRAHFDGIEIGLRIDGTEQAKHRQMEAHAAHHVVRMVLRIVGGRRRCSCSRRRRQEVHGVGRRLLVRYTVGERSAGKSGQIDGRRLGRLVLVGRVM